MLPKTPTLRPCGTAGTPPAAIDTGTPSRSRRSTLLICDCSPPICDWKPADRLLSWLTLTASVGLMPAATLVRRRSLPGDPNETVFGALASDPAPMATEFAASAEALAPSATADAPLAVAAMPPANARAPLAVEPWPIAVAPVALAMLA